MKQIEIHGWIWAKPAEYSNEVIYEFSHFDYEHFAKTEHGLSDWHSYKKVKEHTITIEVPELDAIQMKLAGLQAKKQSVMAELGRRVAEIEDQISKLTAIEYKPIEGDDHEMD